MKLRRIFIPLAMTAACIGLASCGAKKTSSPSTPEETQVTTYKVNFFTFGGDNIPSQNVKSGEKISAVSTTRTGYVFVGWYKDVEATIPFDVNSPITESTSLYAKWVQEGSAEATKYTVTFETNGGSSVSPQNVVSGALVGSIATPTRSGYTFAGWYTNSGLTTPFSTSTPITANITLYAKWVENQGSGVTTTYTVTFETNGGTAIGPKVVNAGATIGSITSPTKAGNTFAGWYTNSGLTSAFNASAPVTANMTLYAKWTSSSNPSTKPVEVTPSPEGEGEIINAGDLAVANCGGEYESAFIEFKTSTQYSDYNLYISTKGANDFKKLTNNRDYYVQAAGGNGRIDISGLKSGDYDLKLVSAKEGNDMGQASTMTVKVVAYDRSGYAHFNRPLGSVAAKGVGAYNDDGTLKDNAIVIYVTDQNKNDVELTVGSKTVKGIGNILNSTGKACGEAGHETQCKRVSGKGSVSYGIGNKNDDILTDLSASGKPLALRFVGMVSDSGLYEAGTFSASSKSLIDGLTAYNSVDYGGIPGDNGHMARMKNATSVTVEGIGNEAGLDGWGIHFMCSNAHPEYGKSFEARNLAFINQPEDALGMEGEATSTKITASVDRCWVHNNTFIGPHITNPAESDKSEGDGSCDFKRGMYFTNSYNYYEKCHKTNLMGSSSDSLQFNLTFHHNLWNQCEARQPLVRHSNVHFYNNFIYGTSDTVASCRASSYLYSEYNYYLGCSRPCELKAEGSVGVAKGYGNNVIGCYNDNSFVEAKTRDEKVAGSSICKYGDISYEDFDTNPTLFYYNKALKQSDCYITDADQARVEVVKKAGSGYRTVLDKTDYKTTATIVNIGTPEKINLSNGIVTITKPKAKGVIYSFTLDSAASVTLAMTASAGFDTGYLLAEDGKVIIEAAATDKTAQLEPGTYVIISGQIDATGKNTKESTITKLTFEKFESEAFNEKLVAEYNAAKNAIPASISFTDSCYTAINNAEKAYNKLSNELKGTVDYTPVEAALIEYKTKGVAAVEAAINAIGAVDKTSGAKIDAARNLYSKLSGQYSDLAVSNYATLVAAEEAFSSFAVTACIEAIDGIGEVTLAKKADVEYASALLSKLDADQQAQVTNKAKLQAAIAELEILEAVADVENDIANVELDNVVNMKEVLDSYNSLTDAQKAKVSNASQISTIKVAYAKALINALPTTIAATDKANIDAASAAYNVLTADEKTLVDNYAKLDDAKTKLQTILDAQIVCTFNGAPSNSLVTVSGTYGSTSATINGETFAKGLKMESATSVSFDLVSTKSVTIYGTAGKTIKINGNDKTFDSNGLITVTLDAGKVTIAKNTTNTLIYKLVIE